MDRTVERLVRQVTAARRAGDDLTHMLVWSRLIALSGKPGFTRSLDRALDIVDWR